jgi:hypothetical protein
MDSEDWLEKEMLDSKHFKINTSKNVIDFALSCPNSMLGIVWPSEYLVHTERLCWKQPNFTFVTGYQLGIVSGLGEVHFPSQF